MKFRSMGIETKYRDKTMDILHIFVDQETNQIPQKCNIL